mmetsp:Transcript_19550/g.29608  ORF Transcript_19550/g.29608 Transcript_19550/m.29608 type:complete len:81 (-) Transcript_19550:701-943(-)
MPFQKIHQAGECLILFRYCNGKKPFPRRKKSLSKSTMCCMKNERHKVPFHTPTTINSSINKMISIRAINRTPLAIRQWQS